MATSASEHLRFRNKVAIVTGGCDGIGRGCVNVLVANGGKVAVFDIDDEKGETLHAGDVGEIVYFHCDMRDEEQIKNAIAKTVERFGQIDCLVNNVGSVRKQDQARIDDLTVENFKELFNINVLSAFTSSKYSLPHLRKTKGSIINLSSVQATVTTRNFTTYATTKGAIRTFTYALANDEGEHGVRVNCIAPGVVATPLFEKAYDEKARVPFAKCNVLNRFCTPEEVGKLCLFLAVDATYMTGTEVLCDGGIHNKIGVRADDHRDL